MGTIMRNIVHWCHPHLMNITAMLLINAWPYLTWPKWLVDWICITRNFLHIFSYSRNRHSIERRTHNGWSNLFWLPIVWTETTLTTTPSRVVTLIHIAHCSSVDKPKNNLLVSLNVADFSKSNSVKYYQSIQLAEGLALLLLPKKCNTKEGCV